MTIVGQDRLGTKEFNYAKLFQDTKGTKTIKVTKDVYDSLLYCKGMNLRESMTKTIARLGKWYQYDCEPIKHCDKNTENTFFKVKNIDEKERKIPTFSTERRIIRVSVDLHKELTTLKCHPEESLNMVIFRLLCSHYENKAIYRIFTGSGCGNCDMLKNIVKSLMSGDNKLKESIYVEFVNGDAVEHRAIMLKHKVEMLPLSILYNFDGEEVWSVSGFHDSEIVEDELKKIAAQAQSYIQ
jgi:predicted CopG family antitoxin